jgi:hypothetical protein
VNRVFLVLHPRFTVRRHRIFHLLLGGHVEERLQVLTELLFLQDRLLGADTEEYNYFGDGSPVNIVNDEVAYLLWAHTWCSLTCSSSRAF